MENPREIRPPAKIIDLHSHWGTERGYALRSPDEQARQETTWKSKARFVSESEMTDYFRQSNVRTILDLGFTRYLAIDEVRPLHDYAIEVAAANADVILGLWITIDPRTGAQGLAEIERCRNAYGGFVGFVAATAPLGLAPTDEVFEPFYEMCIDTRMPVLITVGTTGLGAGTPGGGGIRLELGSPMLVDAVAAAHPDLKILAGRPAWPWQSEMIAVLLHKSNVWYELHGWSPKYYTDELKREIGKRLKDRVMFGADYPMFTYERLIDDWRELGYADDIYAKVFHENALRFLAVED